MIVEVAWLEPAAVQKQHHAVVEVPCGHGMGGMRELAGGAHAVAGLPANAVRELRGAPVELESLEIEPQVRRQRPEVWIVGVPRIAKQRVVELPEASLQPGGPSPSMRAPLESKCATIG